MRQGFLIYLLVVISSSSYLSWRDMVQSARQQSGGSGSSWRSSGGGGGWASAGGGHK
jgi:hypothetical protein